MAYYSSQLKTLLELTVKREATDLHLSVGHPPILRINGQLTPLKEEPVLTPDDTERLARFLLTDQQEERLLKEREIDFSYEFEKKARFRANVFYRRGVISIALRRIPIKIPTLDELNRPAILHRFAQAEQGFLLITGPSSHGKSTTLASLVDEINHTRPVHIITIEDPIEFVFEDDKAVIDQREVGSDTLSFPKALRSALRQDPDVIMVGEMRDPETISTALTAAETGHLVLSTLHTNSAAETIHRIVDSFPGEQQNQVRSQLSGCLLGIISQRLLPRLRGGLTVACEIMINTPATANLIRENKIYEIPSIIQTSSESGMMSLNKSLAELVKKREISLETALAYSLNPDELLILLRE